MSLIDSVIGQFRVSVSKASGSPLAGAYIRVLTGTGEDATSRVAGASPVRSTSSGIFQVNVLKVGVVAPGQYTIIVSAPGFVSASQQTSTVFTGEGSFDFVLQPHAAGEYVVSLPESGYVSALQPIQATVRAPQASLGDWQLIEALLSRDDNSITPVESPVPASGEASLGLSSRLRLKPVLYLVADGQDAVVDDDLFREFSMSLSVVNDNGTIDLSADGAYSLVAGNVQPTGDTNDLSAYTSADGLASWLTPYNELPAFAGYYADCSVVLHQAGSDYSLETRYLNAARTQIGDAVESDAFAAPGKKAVKVRIPDAGDGASYAELTILKNSVAVTQPLTVKYL